MAGFEPTNARVKVWCLTAWRHLNVATLVVYEGRTVATKSLVAEGWIRTNDFQFMRLAT